MLISQVGEFALIKRFRKAIRTDASVIVGSGDDCAVLAHDKKHYQLFTCDMLVEGVDFKSCEDPYLIGRKAIAVSVSDIASCGGLPRHAVISLGMPKNTPLKFIDTLFKGMMSVARKYKINIVGGDLSRAQSIVIDVSMLGLAEKKNLLLRSRAKKGDIIFVSGALGGSIRGKHLKFIPRLKEAQFLVRNFKVNSMIDVSDGLAQDLNHILEESKVGAVIYEKSVPLSKDALNLDEALYMGEDFELLFTVPPKEAKSLRQHRNFRPIGEILDKSLGLSLMDKNGRARKLALKGFRHF